MEKFAVDLDKVLDDFELQEDQAEQVAKSSVHSNIPKDASFSLKPEKEKSYFNISSPLYYPIKRQGTSPVFEPEELSVAGKEEGNNIDTETEKLVNVWENIVDKVEDVHSNTVDLLVDFSNSSEIKDVKETSCVFQTSVDNPTTVNGALQPVTLESFAERLTPPTLINSEELHVADENAAQMLINESLESVSIDNEPTEEELNLYLEKLEKEDLESGKDTVIFNSSITDVSNGENAAECISDGVPNVVWKEDDVQVSSKTESIAEDLSAAELDGEDACQNDTEIERREAQFMDHSNNFVYQQVSLETSSTLNSEQTVAAQTSHEEGSIVNSSSAALEQDTIPVETSIVEDIVIDNCISNETSERLEPEIASVLPCVEVEGDESTGSSLEPYSSLTDDERNLGLLKPIWIADEEAPLCMHCGLRFTVIRRRHHCRACGRVLCSSCCSSRARLKYLESKEARVCLPCLQVLHKVQAYKKWGTSGDHSSSQHADSSSSPSLSSSASTPISSPSAHTPSVRVNPNNPAEYCSTIPPPLQAAAAAALPPPSVMVPVGVLKKEGSSSNQKHRSEPKQVIFSDGIRPGGDLTELDSWRVATAEGQPVSNKAQRKIPKPITVVPFTADDNNEKKPAAISLGHNLPPLLSDIHTIEKLIDTLADPKLPPVVFAMESSHPAKADRPTLRVTVKLLSLDCCVRRKCWCFTTAGMRWVAQDEILLLIEQETISEDETTVESLPPVDIFSHLLSIYEEAACNRHVVNMGHTVTTGTFLGSTEHGGFVFFRTSFQCIQQLVLPTPPYLVGLLLQRWEIPWAKVFPLRLLLRLGAEFRYYPCPLFSVRRRKPVFAEVGHTIINLLADMRNFSYSLPSVAGLVVHMEERETNILLPRSRYPQVCKALAQSNDHVISLAASFSSAADAHLVCLQQDDGSYQTQAINIHTRPRKVTGASFVVFNGALKSSSGLSGRSSIVEDGVMVQLLPDTLESLKQSLIRMEDYVIVCGKTAAPQPEETVNLKWVDNEYSPVNQGVVSPIDGRCLSGVSSIRVMQPRDYKGEGHRLLRWTELFLIHTEENIRSGSNKTGENSDVTRFAESVAKAASMALATKLAHLTPHNLVGLRVSLDGDSVEYQAGADQKPIPNICTEELDSSLIPLLHRESAAQSLPCTLELWFRILHP